MAEAAAGLASIVDRWELLGQQQQLTGGRRSCGAEIVEEGRWRRGLRKRKQLQSELPEGVCIGIDNVSTLSWKRLGQRGVGGFKGRKQ